MEPRGVQMTKPCSKCKQLLPKESFGKHAYRKDGLNHKCKDCNRQYNRQYSAKESYKAQRSKHRRAHAGERNAECVAWRKNNTEKSKIYAARTRARLPDGLIRRRLCEKTSLAPADIPQVLVEAKREQLRIIREIKKGERP